MPSISPPEKTPVPPRRPVSFWMGTLALRLTVLWVGVALLVMMSTGGGLYFMLSKALYEEQDQFLMEKVRVMRVLSANRANDSAELKEEVEEDWAPRQYMSVSARFVDDTGNIRAESPKMSKLLPRTIFPPPIALGAAAITGIDFHSGHRGTFRIASALAPGPQGSPPWTIEVALDATPQERLLRRLRWLAIWTFGVAAAVFAMVGLIAVRSGLRPLRRIAETAQSIRQTTLNQRIDVTGFPSELLEPAHRFNSMLDRLQDSFDRLTQFSGDLAHELRTPLTNMQGAMELALSRNRSAEQYRDFLGSSIEECVRLGRLIDGLLFLARADDPRGQIQLEQVDVAAELKHLGNFYAALALDRDITLRVNCPEPVQARLDRMLLRRAVDNLVANAVTHTSAGGVVTLAASREGESLCIKVIDTGEGIPSEHLPHVFKRFYRVDHDGSRGNAGHAGLGLAIVKGIMTLHGGNVSIRSAPGHGTSVTLHFPDPSAPANRSGV